MIFGIIDIGRLVDARLVVTNLSREGANLASRDLKSGTDLPDYLASSVVVPINLIHVRDNLHDDDHGGRKSASSPDPVIASQISTGNLEAASVISANAENLGLTGAMYNHLVYNPENKVADILGVSVVEVYYQYTPMTPLASFVPGLLTGCRRRYRQHGRFLQFRRDLMGKGIAGNQRGTVLVTFALLLTALLGFVALGIEVGTWYLMRAELSKAVDAAALAGAANIASPNVNLAALAQDFGDANFAPGYLGTVSLRQRRRRLRGKQHRLPDDGDGNRQRGTGTHHHAFRGHDHPGVGDGGCPEERGRDHARPRLLGRPWRVSPSRT